MQHACDPVQSRPKRYLVTLSAQPAAQPAAPNLQNASECGHKHSLPCAMQCILQVRIVAMPLASVLGLKSRFAGNGGEECSVEELALQHYASPEGGGWTGKCSGPACMLDLMPHVYCCLVC